MAITTILYSNFLNPISKIRADFLPHYALSFTSETITYFGPIEHLPKTEKKEGEENFYDFSDCVVLPAFFDLHFHWVQWGVRQQPKKDLMHWLREFTWPAEQKFQDYSYAKIQAENFSLELQKRGIAGGACYGSVHPHTVSLGLEYFKGDFILGNVLMTMNSPEYLQKSQERSKEEALELYKQYGKKYCLTPRFAPTTHPELMQDLGQEAHNRKGFIQTHLSENLEEIQFVTEFYKKEFPLYAPEGSDSYTEIYHHCGLLGPRTILGHAIHLSPKEWNLLKRTQTILAHCPTSNAPIEEDGLGSGLFDYETADALNIPWGLGSDIGGGPSLSPFDVLNSFVFQQERAKKIHTSFTKGLFHYTKGNASLLGHSFKGYFAAQTDASGVILPLPHSLKENLSSWKAEEILSRILKRPLHKRAEFENLASHCFIKGELLSGDWGEKKKNRPQVAH